MEYSDLVEVVESVAWVLVHPFQDRLKDVVPDDLQFGGGHQLQQQVRRQSQERVLALDLLEVTVGHTIKHFV